MATNHPKAGPNSVPAYQLSGIPFTTGSAPGEVPATNGTPIKIEFPYVTRFIQVQASGSQGVRVGFSSNGVRSNPTSNYFVVDGGTTSNVLELRTKEIFILSNSTAKSEFRLTAGLTTIKSTEFPTLTGSLSDGALGFEGVG